MLAGWSHRYPGLPTAKAKQRGACFAIPHNRFHNLFGRPLTAHKKRIFRAGQKLLSSSWCVWWINNNCVLGATVSNEGKPIVCGHTLSHFWCPLDTCVYVSASRKKSKTHRKTITRNQYDNNETKKNVCASYAQNTNWPLLWKLIPSSLLAPLLFHRGVPSLASSVRFLHVLSFFLRVYVVQYTTFVSALECQPEICFNDRAGPVRVIDRFAVVIIMYEKRAIPVFCLSHNRIHMCFFDQK